ncbi:MAG: hypothetical protein RIB46_11165 [Pseudomonadales bacterium]
MPSPQPPSSSSRRLAIAAGALVLIGIGLLVPLPAAWDDRPVLGIVENLVHAPLFAAVACLTLWLLPGPTTGRYLLAAFMALALAVASELAQGLMSRDASWLDVRTDALGAAAGLALWRLVVEPGQEPTASGRLALGGVALLCIGLALLPAAAPIGAAVARASHFPVLFSARFPGALTMVEAFAEPEGVAIRVDGAALRVTPLSGRFPGVVITSFAGDWRGFGALVIDVETLGSQPLVLEAHIRDRGGSAAYGERFNARWTLPAGARQAIRVPLADIAAGPRQRRLRLDRVGVIAIHRADDVAEPFLIRDVYLSDG